MARSFFNLLKTAAHGAASYNKPTEVSISETLNIARSRAGGEQGPAATAIQEYDCAVDVTFDVIGSPLAKSTAKGSFTAGICDDLGVTATVTVANHKVGESTMRLSNDIMKQTQHLYYEGTSIEPISVSG